MGWGEPAEFYEGEDENALRLRFCQLSAQYPDHSPYDIGDYVFREAGLEAGMRGQDAGFKWSNNLEVKETIRRLRQTGGPEPVVPSKAELVAELVTLARQPTLDAKDRVAAYRTVLEAEGHITKLVDKSPKARVYPKIVYDLDEVSKATPA